MNKGLKKPADEAACDPRSRKAVVITDLRTREARDAAAYLTDLGYSVHPVPESIALYDEQALSAFAQPLADTLLGVIHPAPPLFLSPLLETSEEDFAKARDEGPLSAWCVTKVFGGLFRRRREGCLIYLSSIHAEKPVGHGFLFSTGCGAVQMLSREVSQDYGTSGIRSYFVQRGPTDSDPDGRTPLSTLYCGLPLRYPSRRMPPRGQLNPLLAFLLTPESAPLSGSDLRADSGMTMYYGERITAEQAEEIHQRRLRGEEGSILGEK